MGLTDRLFQSFSIFIKMIQGYQPVFDLADQSPIADEGLIGLAAFMMQRAIESAVLGITKGSRDIKLTGLKQGHKTGKEIQRTLLADECSMQRIVRVGLRAS